MTEADHFAATVRVETIFGPMLAFEGDHITRHLIEFGAHTRPELALLSSLVDAGDRVFDIGGHIGTWALPLALKVGAAGQVVTVEATEKHFDLLQANLALHPDAPITAVRALIGPADLALSAGGIDGNTGARWFEPAADADQADTTPRLTLDALTGRFGAPRVIKLDIEGFEHFALSVGANRTLADRPVLYVEVCDAHLRRSGCGSSAALDALLTDLGYRFFRNTGRGNGAWDHYTLAPLDRLPEDFFNLVAVHEDDPRLQRLHYQIAAQGAPA